MKRLIINKVEDVPNIDHELLNEMLSDEEHAQFLFVETTLGETVCFINSEADNVFKQRAQSLRSFQLSDRVVKTLYVTPELLTILRDQVMAHSEAVLVNESELDKKFNDVLLQAVQSGTSDIHIDIFPERADLKFRIHGMISKVGEMDSRTANRLINYVYNVAAAEGSKDTQYNPDEMQDALLDRFLEINGTRSRYKLRLQTAPCYPNSMTIIMRVLPVDNQLSSTLESLGYSEHQMHLLKQAQQNPSGAIIIAGTTGSGKSTTLATMLVDTYRRTKGMKKIITTEDPPEYTIEGANQINLSAKKNAIEQGGSSSDLFVKAIKVAMRSDPDIIMVGEVRDEQSSTLLSSAVLSGHQVYTTVHASGGLAIIDRMINLGFEKSLITTPHFLSLLIYQCLVPSVCQHCAIPYEAFIKKELGEFDQDCVNRLQALIHSDRYKSIIESSDAMQKLVFANHDGCSKCRFGYTGRTVLAEMVVPSAALMEHIRNGEFEKAHHYWLEHDGQTVLEHGIEKMLAGHIDPRSVEDKCGALTNALKDI